MKYKIYILICPVDKCVRYIGITTQTLAQRLSRHLSDDKKRNPHKYNWINKLKKNDLKPSIKLVCENLTEIEACKREIQLISIMKGIIGNKLTNHHEGGTIPPSWKDRKHTIKTKMKLSKPVLQLKLNGQIVNRYYSIAEAARKTGINRTGINKCCLKKRKTAGCFIWRYT